MKKILLWGGSIIAVLALGAVLAVSLFLDDELKSGVELVGSKLTRVDVKLEKASLSLWSGSGALNGLVISNPEGYKSTNAISVGRARLSVKPASLFSDKIIIRQIEVASPDITFEGGLSGNNFSKILANIEEATGTKGTNAVVDPAADKTAKKANHKLEVDDFLISGATVHLHVTVPGMNEQSLSVVMQDIHLTNLGTGPDGITSAELTKLVLAKIEKEAGREAEKAAADLGKHALRDLGKSGSLSNATGGLHDLFKKKK